MNIESFLETVRNGESSLVEFKTEDVRADSLAAEMVSFANFEGGTIYIGVADNGDIIGCQRADVEEFIVNVCRNNVRPSIIPVIERLRYNDSLIYTVKINPGITPHATSSGLYYIRVGSTKQIPTQQELLRLFQRKNLLQYDETPVLNATLKTLSISKINGYVERLGQGSLADNDSDALQNDLINLSIVTETEAGAKPTVAGLLNFGINPQKYFSSISILCGYYQGNSTNEPALTEKNISGTLDEQIEGTIAFLKMHIAQDVSTENKIQRSDQYRYSIDALREAVVNAVAHRDYTISGSSIRINIFSSAIEIRSPGNLPNTLTLESMKYRQFTRNQTIVSFLTGLGYMERRGKGISRMVQQSKNANTHCMIFLTPDNQELVVRFEL